MLHPDEKFFLRKRYFVCFWTCVGFIMNFILRSNMSIAIVEMTSEKTFVNENGTVIKTAAEFDWDAKQKGFIISLFSYGYFFVPIGGLLTLKFGGATMFGFGVASTASLTVISPFLLRINFIYFAIARILEGVFEGISASAFLNIFIHWAPPHELSRLTLLGVVGVYLGIFFNYAFCGLIAQHLGVNAIFTVTGGVTLVWYLIWLLLISNNPASDRFITQTEKKYLENLIIVANKKETKMRRYPWSKIFTSKPVWALFNEFFCSTWITSFVSFCLPIYVKDVFDVDIQSVGFISGIPILGNFIGLIMWAFVSDYLRSHKILPIPRVHLLFLATGQLSSVLLLIIISQWANFTQSIICFTLMRILYAAAEVSYQLLFIDMFSELAAVIRGFSLIFYNAAMLLNPTVMGFMVTDHSKASWNFYFLFLSAFNIFSLVAFWLFGSGELQEWADCRNEDIQQKKDSEYKT